MTHPRLLIAMIPCAILAQAFPGRIGLSDCQAQDKPKWTLRVSMDAPSLASPAVPFAIFDYDPLPKFSAALGEMRESFKKQLSQAPDSEQLEIIRSAQMLIAWNSLFEEMGTKIQALSPRELPRLSMSFKKPAEPKWIVSMTVMLKGVSHPVFWSLPIIPDSEKMLPVEFNENNYLRLEPIYNSILAASKEKM